MRALLALAVVLGGCVSAKETIAFGAGAIAAGALGLELASRTEDPLRTPLEAHALPTLAVGVALLAGGLAVAIDGPQPVGY
jgi:hypothetical protein